MARNVLALKNAPRGLGLQFYAVIWLLMDRLQPAPWMWGTIGAICAFSFVATCIDLATSSKFEISDTGKLTDGT